MTTADDIQADLNNAIAAVIARHEGGFVTKWVALVETAGPDGERGTWTLAGDGMKAWDTIGLLQYGLYLEQLHLGLHYTRGDDDDD